MEVALFKDSDKINKSGNLDLHIQVLHNTIRSPTMMANTQSFRGNGS
jgi:hypothetical protein